MKIDSNFKDLLRAFDAAGGRYLVVGGHAVMKYTEPYGTKDLEISIEASEANAAATLVALTQFGAPIWRADQRALRPRLPESGDGEAWARRSDAQFDSVTVPIVSLDDLIVAKRTAGRPKDLIQARQFEKRKETRLETPLSTGVLRPASPVT